MLTRNQPLLTVAELHRAHVGVMEQLAIAVSFRREADIVIFSLAERALAELKDLRQRERIR